MVVLTVISLVVALGCAAALAVVATRRPEPTPSTVPHDLVAATVAALRAEQVATVQAAVESVVSVAGEQLGNRVEVADRVLEQRQAAISLALDEERNAVGQELQEARRQLTQMADMVLELRRERAEQQGRLEQGLAEAVRTTSALAGTTDALRQALASTKARGQWGERMAEDVLRAAGFVEGVNYRKQTAIAGGTIPDLSFPLPGGRELHMDVKFPFDNYVRSLEATTDGERETFEARFIGDVKQRIREITTRSYIDAETTVDHVVLFIPNESIFAFVHERDPGLIDHAISQKVVVCSPSTLFAVLAVVRQAVEQFRLERTSDEILACLASFEKEWTKYAEGFAKLGAQMNTAAKTYDTLAGTRTNQLERTLRHIERLRDERGLEAITPLAVAAADPTDPADGRDREPDLHLDLLGHVTTRSEAHGAAEASPDEHVLDAAVGEHHRTVTRRSTTLRLK